MIDQSRIATLAASGRSDKEIARELGISTIAAQHRRQRAGIPLHQRCRECGELFALTGRQNRSVAYCSACLAFVVALYLCTPLPVRRFIRHYRISDATLRMLALELYGKTRGELTEGERADLLSELFERKQSVNR